MKKSYIYIASGVLVVVIVTSVIAMSDAAKPGDKLYKLDRSVESLQLSSTRNTNPLRYAEINLDLASERLQEIKALKNPITAFASINVHAQTTTTESDNLSQLIADFNQNLTEAQSVLETLSGTEKTSLSLLIAGKTTEFGNEIVTISKDLTTEEVSEFNDSVSLLEDIDDDAVSGLLETEIEDDSMYPEITVALQDKLETKLLRQRESLRILSEYFAANNSTFTEEEISIVQTAISEIGNKLSSAEGYLSDGNLQMVADILDGNADSLDELRDAVTPEDGTDPFDAAGEDTQENEIENEVETEQEPETETDNNETEDVEDNKSNETEKPEPTEKPEEPESPEEPEQPEEPEHSEDPESEDTLGVKTGRGIVSNDWFNNSLRF